MQDLTTELSVQLHLEIVLAHRSLSVVTICSSNNDSNSETVAIVIVTVTLGFECGRHRDGWMGVTWTSLNM